MRLVALDVGVTRDERRERRRRNRSRLPAVPVTAKSELVRSAKLREFDRRRSNGIGRFLTEADLEKDQYRKLSDVSGSCPA